MATAVEHNGESVAFEAPLQPFINSSPSIFIQKDVKLVSKNLNDRNYNHYFLNNYA